MDTILTILGMIMLIIIISLGLIAFATLLLNLFDKIQSSIKGVRYFALYILNFKEINKYIDKNKK